MMKLDLMTTLEHFNDQYYDYEPITAKLDLYASFVHMENMLEQLNV